MGRDFQPDFDALLKDMLGEYRRATDEGLDDAAEIMRESAEKHSPVGNSAQHYKEMWDVVRYPGSRYVGNRKMVGYKFKDRSAKTIPLINILEYSYSHGHPHVSAAFNSCYEKMFEAIKKRLEEVK